MVKVTILTTATITTTEIGDSIRTRRAFRSTFVNGPFPAAGLYEPGQTQRREKSPTTKQWRPGDARLKLREQTFFWWKRYVRKFPSGRGIQGRTSSYGRRMQKRTFFKKKTRREHHTDKGKIFPTFKRDIAFSEVQAKYKNPVVKELQVA